MGIQAEGTSGSAITPEECVARLDYDATSMDGAVLRKAFGCFPSGVVGVAAFVDGAPLGMAASTFVPVSLDPPLVAFCVQTSSSTWPMLRDVGRLGISVLGATHDLAARQLAAKAAHTRFDGLSYMSTPEGSVFIDGASAWLDCEVHSAVSAGDHEIVLLELRGLTTTPDIEPLVFHASAFRQLQQGAA